MWKSTASREKMADPPKSVNSAAPASVPAAIHKSATMEDYLNETSGAATSNANESGQKDDRRDNNEKHRQRGRGGRDFQRGRGRNAHGGHGSNKHHRKWDDNNKERARHDNRPSTHKDEHYAAGAEGSNMSIRFPAEEIAAETRRPKAKVAVLIGYAGTGYKGMQMNHTEKTIEGDLFGAFVAAGAIQKMNADDPKKSSFMRCARTDKGVHAAGNVISLKLTVDEPNVVEMINEKLPEQIRVWGQLRTNNAFNCYKACDSRWYEYLLPTYTLLPPHPQTFLGKKVIESAKEKGVYDGILRAWDDVEDYWDNVEKNHIQPILDSLDEKTREDVLKVIHASPDFHGHSMEDDAETTAAENEITKTQSAKRKADTDAEENNNDDECEREHAHEHVAKKTKPEDSPEDLDLSGAASQDIKAEELSTAMSSDGVGKDSEYLVTTGSSTEAPENTKETTVFKSKYQSTVAEIAIKQIKNAYLAAKRRYRVTPARIQQLQAALDKYLGTNNFHNYTIQKKYKDPSAKRHIRSFVVNSTPILIRDTEWVSLKVHGQSFMMHQIRKMVAMAVLCVRCAVPLERIQQSYGPTRISIPKAPGLGLLLERPVFESYSKKAQESLGREPLNFDKYEKEIEEFKHRQIYTRIWNTEEKEASFHVFLHQLDSFETNSFLWLTAHGVEAAHEPKERHEPKTKPKLSASADQQQARKEMNELIDSDYEDAVSDGNGDEG